MTRFLASRRTALAIHRAEEVSNRQAQQGEDNLWIYLTRQLGIDLTAFIVRVAKECHLSYRYAYSRTVTRYLNLGDMANMIKVVDILL